MASRILPTISAIARDLKVGRARVAYLVRKLGLQPDAIAGRTGVYSNEAIMAIRLAWADIERRRRGAIQ